MNERIRGLLNEATFGLETDLSKQRTVTLNEIEKFAALVAAAEREACAKVCEDSINAIFEFSDEIVKETAHNVCINLAKGIRARGNE